jgi:hypothetical protein
MNSLLIMGAGRSGTSMVAGLFRNSPAHMGNRSYEATESNPRGYFEDREVNEVNDLLIASSWQWRATRLVGRRLAPPAHLDPRAYFVAAPRWVWPNRPSGPLLARMRRLLDQRPFCYKDPRFNVTLPSWRRVLPDGTRFIVVFRDPGRTITSLMRFAAAEDYSPPLPLTPEWCRIAWLRTYDRLLNRYSRRGEWLFVEYDDVLSGRAIDAIRSFTGVEPDTTQIEASLSRSTPYRQANSDPESESLYGELRRRAADDLGTWSASRGGMIQARPASDS